MNKRCLHCGKELLPKEGQKEIHTNRIYCDSTCSSRFIANKHYNINKDKPEYKEKRHDFYTNVWYPNNKEKQNENVKRDYHAHTEIWNERKFTNQQREKIMQFINPFCSCGKPTKILFHKQFGNRPLLKTGGRNEESKAYNLDLVKKYTEENLIGVCSKLCLEREKRELK